MSGSNSAAPAFRRPTEADYPVLVRAIDDWWADRRTVTRLPRLWLRHFTGTSWLATDAEGRIIGFLVGFLSPDRADEACLHLVGVDPNRRRRGIGRALVERSVADATAAGRHRLVVTVSPDDPATLAFLRAVGFEVDAGPGTKPLYGVPAIPGFDFGREDAAVLIRQT